MDLNKLTKAQLIDQLQDAEAKLSALKADNFELEMEIGQAKAALVSMAEVASAINAANKAKPVKPTYIQPQWQLDRLAAMAAAREEAMRTGLSVRV